MNKSTKSQKSSRRALGAYKRSLSVEGDDAFVDFICAQPADLGEDVLLLRTFETRRNQLLDLANLRDDGMAWFGQRWAHRVRTELDEDILELREQLRFVWGKPSCESTEEILNTWLAWRPSARHWKRYQRMDIPLPLVEERRDFVAFHCNLEAGRLVPDFGNFRSMLLQGVLEHWRYFKICENPECAAPYFIAARQDQRICGAEACKAEKQRQHALKWWRENRSKKSSVRKPNGEKNGPA